MRPEARRSPRERVLIRKAVHSLIAVLFVAALAVFDCCFSYYALLPAADLSARKEGELRLHFLDVGQGDCTVVEFPEGDVLVIDAGGESRSDHIKLVRYLKGLHPVSVSMLATHSDLDHIGGFSVLLSEFGAETFYLPAFDDGSGEYDALLAAAEEAGCRQVALSRYCTISRPCGAYLVCLSPYSSGETDGNDASVVLYLSYLGTTAVLCGDISSAREKLLVRENALDETLFSSETCSVRLSDTDILKVAHHGSADSSSAEWLDLLDAEVAVISCGRGNTYSHPAGETLDRLSAAGAEIYRTDELGDIVIGIGADGYLISIKQED